jgi:hypothetical protein
MAAQISHCAFCDSSERLEKAVCCGVLVCTRHRSGTGSLGDGYTCDAHPFFPDFPVTPLQDFSPASQKPVEGLMLRLKRLFQRRVV